MKGLFALVVFAMTLTLAQSTSVTWGGAHGEDSVKTGVAPGKYAVWFTPTAALAQNQLITITASAAIFSARRAATTAACTSDGTALTPTCTGATTSTTVLKVTLATGTAMAAGKVASITLSSNVAVIPAGTITFSIETTTDTGAITSQTGWPSVTALTAQSLTATRTTLKGTVAGGDLTFGFSPTTKIPSGGTIALTSVQQIWTANEDSSSGGTTACTATQVKPSTGLHTAVTVTKTVITGTTGKIATITMGGILYAGLPVTVTCDGTKNLAVNGADAQAYAFTFATSTDTTATGSATLYTVNKGVAWTSATRATSQIVGVAGGDLVFTFTPKTTVANNGLVTLTASESIFTADAAVTCTATSDGSAATVTSAASTSTAAVANTGTAAKKNILKVTMGADLTLAKVAVITCTTNLANNGATVGAVTFDIETSTDTGKLGKQTGYNLCAASQNVVSGVCTTPSSSSASANSTTASAAAATGTETTVTQVYTFADLTVAAYTGKMKSNCECAYANTVEGASTPTWCVATTSAYTYKSGVTMSSTAAARRAAKVTFVLKVKSSVKTTSQLQTLVASGSTAAAFATALTAVNTASNYTAAPGTATVATATFTGGSSSASTLLPSMLSLVAAIFVAARQ